MLMKRIEAPTLAEAVEKTRVECGDDALLVESRATRNGHVIVAARPPRRETVTQRRSTRLPWTHGFAPLARQAAAFGLGDGVLRAVEQGMIGTRVDLGRPGDPAVAPVAQRILSALIRVSPMDLPDFGVTAFVGPTGVGKTTTLAKLAARAHRERDESVAIITIDTYRVAAVEQLRAFADMIGVPFAVAFTPQDLRREVARHAGVDRIMIDTSGRSPFDLEALAALGSTLKAAECAVALCLSAATRRADALATIGAFRRAGIDRALITKWDETRSPGEVLSVLIERGITLSYIADGQEVPADIAVADPAAIATQAFEIPEEITR